MRSPLIQRQTVEYGENEAFAMHKVIKSGVNRTYRKNSHWHEDLQILYLLQGEASMIIDGEHLQVGPGQPVVINPEVVHRVYIESGAIADPTAIAVLDLMIPRKFLDEQFPEYKTFYFLNDLTKTDRRMQEILLQFVRYDPAMAGPYDRLYMHGLLLQLLWFLCERGVVPRPNDCRHDSLVRLKSILQYIDEHYHEPLTQADIATRFYFTPQYFSRYFKQCTGVTFSEHLTGRRLHGARQELLYTDRLITEIAFNNGFSDERSFINAFKRLYQITPHQYRKTMAENLK